MSEKKSWDVQPKARKREVVRAEPARPLREAPQQRAKLSREPVNTPRKPKPVEAENRSQIANRQPLRERRKVARARIHIALAIMAFLLVAGTLVLVWQPFVRIRTIEATGPNAEGVQAIAQGAIAGTYALVVPRNSIFVYPQNSIRQQILSAYPEIDAVALSRTSFTSLGVKSTSRASAFVWCGAGSVGQTGSSTPTCYDADAEGFIFATSTADTVSTTTDVLRIYAPIDSGDISPLRAHVLVANKIPGALVFIKTLKSMNIAISSLAIHDDEADLYTPLGVRITYVLGHEEEATSLAASSFNTLNVNDPTLDYVDLRFSGKVYVKHKGDTSA